MNIETLQVVIIAALSVSTILITIIGIQVILLLKEVRSITKRLSNLSNGLANISETVQRSILEVGSLSEGAKLVVGLISRLVGHRNNHDREG